MTQKKTTWRWHENPTNLTLGGQLEKAGRVEKCWWIMRCFPLPAMVIKATGWANDDEKVQWAAEECSISWKTGLQEAHHLINAMEKSPLPLWRTPRFSSWQELLVPEVMIAVNPAFHWLSYILTSYLSSSFPEINLGPLSVCVPQKTREVESSYLTLLPKTTCKKKWEKDTDFKMEACKWLHITDIYVFLLRHWGQSLNHADSTSRLGRAQSQWGYPARGKGRGLPGLHNLL